MKDDHIFTFLPLSESEVDHVFDKGSWVVQINKFYVKQFLIADSW